MDRVTPFAISIPFPSLSEIARPSSRGNHLYSVCPAHPRNCEAAGRGNRFHSIRVRAYCPVDRVTPFAISIFLIRFNAVDCHVAYRSSQFRFLFSAHPRNCEAVRPRQSPSFSSCPCILSRGSRHSVRDFDFLIRFNAVDCRVASAPRSFDFLYLFSRNCEAVRPRQSLSFSSCPCILSRGSRHFVRDFDSCFPDTKNPPLQVDFLLATPGGFEPPLPP